MALNKCLFVGGSYDGEWLSVDTNRNLILMQSKIPFKIESKSSECINCGTFATEGYNRMEFKGSIKKFIVYTHNLTPDRVMQLLLDNYRPEKGE